MRWQLPAPTEPRPNEERHVRKFAWTPTYMSDGRTVVWLEYFISTYRFQLVDHAYANYQYYDWALIERKVIA